MTHTCTKTADESLVKVGDQLSLQKFCEVFELNAAEHLDRSRGACQFSMHGSIEDDREVEPFWVDLV